MGSYQFHINFYIKTPTVNIQCLIKLNKNNTRAQHVDIWRL